MCGEWWCHAAIWAARPSCGIRAGNRRELGRQLDAEHAQWQELTRRLALYDTEILTQAKDQADAALLAYQSDAGDFADVMRASIGYLNTRIEHLRLSVDRAQSYAMLVNLGGLTP